MSKSVKITILIVSAVIIIALISTQMSTTTTPTPTSTPTPTPTPKPVIDLSVLKSGIVITTSDTYPTLLSSNNLYSATLQNDANICITDIKNNKKTWCSGSSSGSSNEVYILYIQNDGNICVQGSTTGYKWCIRDGSLSNGSYVLKMDDDGILRQYDSGNTVVWKSA